MRPLLASLLALFPILPLAAQQRPGQTAPTVGYAYPAGGKAGSEVEISVGGMGLA